MIFELSFSDMHLPWRLYKLCPTSLTLVHPAGSLSKGDSGNVGTIGGCREYTGAPFFAASTALTVSYFGAALGIILC